jgi:hypothetical protein
MTKRRVPDKPSIVNLKKISRELYDISCEKYLEKERYKAEDSKGVYYFGRQGTKKQSLFYSEMTPVDDNVSTPNSGK